VGLEMNINGIPQDPPGMIPGEFARYGGGFQMKNIAVK